MAHQLQKLMADTELNGWVAVRSYHAVWLQQLENGRVRQDDVETMLLFHHSLVWHPARPVTKSGDQHTSAPQKKAGKESLAVNIVAKPGMKACATYNHGSCIHPTDHPKELHICAYCLSSVKHSMFIRSVSADANN